MSNLRGLEEQHELSPQLLLRDTRTLGMKTVDFFKNPVNGAFVMVGFGLMSVFIAPLWEITFLLGGFTFLYAFTRKSKLPFRMPQRSGADDYNDTLPNSTMPRKARGISFFGNRRSDEEELWFNNDDMRTHCLIFGSTGSGKTEALISLSFNALVQASGFLYVDGKGDTSLFVKVFSMCRSMGREDDLLLISFMTGAKDIIGAQEKRLSNTMNPFCTGSSSMLSQLVISLMDSGGGQSSDGDMWKGRAMVFVEALMKVLVFMRDKGELLLDANSIRNYFELTRLESIVMDKLLPRDNQDPVSLADTPDLILEPITNYVMNLPGYDRSKKGRQASTVLEQHGFITMQLTRVFGSLADTYGHIIRTNLAEVDLKDVVLNRRILVVLLPALEKSPEELSALGKVIIASLRSMMAAGLGESVEGSYREVITRKPTTALTPYMCILDEYGYYAVKGFAVVPAQARSLGFSVIFAGQDLPAFQKASKEEAASIGANTNIKICMKLEDPTETWEFFHKTAGESYVTKVDSFQTQAGSLLNSYSDNRSASSEKRQRVDLLDLKEQREGEAHIFFKSKIVRAKMFFANPKPIDRIRINQFLKIEPPTSKWVDEFHSGIEQFILLAQQHPGFPAVENEGTEIVTIVEKMQSHEEENLVDRSLAVLMEYCDEVGGATVGEEIFEVQQEVSAEDGTAANGIHIFSEVEFDSAVKALIGRDLEKFKQPLVSRVLAREKIAAFERGMGKNSQQSLALSGEIIKDLIDATYYPPANVTEAFLPLDEVVSMAEQLTAFINNMATQPRKDTDDDDDL